MKNSLPAIILFALFIFIAWSFYVKPTTTPKDFSACAGAGYAILETNPRQCLAPNGQTLTEDLSNFEKLAKTKTASSSQTSLSNKTTSSQATTTTLDKNPPQNASTSSKSSKNGSFPNP